MALISKIRKNSWLMIIMVGLGLGGFIIMDMVSGQQSIFGSQRMSTLGEVNGRKIDMGEFNRAESILYNNSGSDIYSRRKQLWDFMVEKEIVLNEAEDLGLTVSKEELVELQFGINPHPIIQERFRDPNTGRLNREQLMQFKTQIDNGQLAQDPNLGPFWAYQEQEIIKERIQEKFVTMATQAIYVPTWMAEMNFVDQNLKVDFAFVKVPFDEVDNSAIEVTDADLENYLKENKKKYVEKVEVRKVDYVTFDVLPTAADSAAIYTALDTLKPKFENTENDSLFVLYNNGSFDPAFVTKDFLPTPIREEVANMEVGTVYGPFVDNRRYILAKLVDRKIIPDSVRSRHILLQAQDPQGYLAAQVKLDSLKSLIEAGTNTFDELAREFSQGPSSTDGGDLGFAARNAMVKPFNDLIFFQAEKEELNIVATQFGLHLVEVTDKKFINNEEGVQMAFVSLPIIPSEDTQKDIYATVLEFVAQNRDLASLSKSAANNDNLEIQTSPPLKQNDFRVGVLPPSNSSRDLVKWAFSSEAEVTKVSPAIYIFQDPVELFESQYVVAGLKSIRRAGNVNVAEIREEIQPVVMNIKKGEILKGKISGNDLSAIANQFSTKVDTARAVPFGTFNIQNMGNEPKAVATAFNLNNGEVSQPVVGENGVYVIKMLNKPQAPPTRNIPAMRKLMTGSSKNAIASRLISSMISDAEIEDYRSTFY